jgi:hypothetical protein
MRSWTRCKFQKCSTCEEVYAISNAPQVTTMRFVLILKGIANWNSRPRSRLHPGSMMVDFGIGGGRERPTGSIAGRCEPSENRSFDSAHRSMYVIDAKHYLNDKGYIAPERGAARKMADFVTSVIAHASDFDRPDERPDPACFRCRKRDDRCVNTGIADDGAVVWNCPACGTSGRIANWEGTFWDLSSGMPSD